ncbi:hypothetical protein VPH35_054753 [Triticum aestivum]|uniref:Peptidase S26 domain-containing protein n=2 Tax=Triticum TaxID=4564 RepID=A0A9R1QU53_TRITD|nr:unnamed protein product [Triticum aestivum]VAH83584.1 unnamed protein product [Triticum turgidum subsp. durum]
MARARPSTTLWSLVNTVGAGILSVDFPVRSTGLAIACGGPAMLPTFESRPGDLLLVDRRRLGWFHGNVVAFRTREMSRVFSSGSSRSSAAHDQQGAFHTQLSIDVKVRVISSVLTTKSWRTHATLVIHNRSLDGHGKEPIFSEGKTYHRGVVSRLIALPGDLVRLRGTTEFLEVPEGHCWVEGDNPSQSKDSRTYGPVPLELLEGTVTHIIWPPHRMAAVPGRVPEERVRLIIDPAGSAKERTGIAHSCGSVAPPSSGTEGGGPSLGSHKEGLCRSDCNFIWDNIHDLGDAGHRDQEQRRPGLLDEAGAAWRAKQAAAVRVGEQQQARRDLGADEETREVVGSWTATQDLTASWHGRQARASELAGEDGSGNGTTYLRRQPSSISCPSPSPIHLRLLSSLLHTPSARVLASRTRGARVAEERGDYGGWLIYSLIHLLGAGDYSTAIAFQERIRLPDKTIEYYDGQGRPWPRRVVGRVALVGDAAAGYVTRCSGEGIYFAAKSGQLCGQAMAKEWLLTVVVTEGGFRRGYLRRWDDEFLLTFQFLDLRQRMFYGDNAGREALVDMCADEHMQRRTFDCYLPKRMAPGEPWANL